MLCHAHQEGHALPLPSVVSAWTCTTIHCRSEFGGAPLICPPAGVEAGTTRAGAGPQGHAAAHAAAGQVGWQASGRQPWAACRGPGSPGASDRGRWLCTRHWWARRVRSRAGWQARTAAAAAAAAASAAEGGARFRRPAAAGARPHACAAAGAGPGRGQAAAAAALRCCCCSSAELLQEKRGACCCAAPAASGACTQAAASGTEAAADKSGAAGCVDEGAHHSAGVRGMVQCVMLQGPSHGSGVLRAQRWCPVLCSLLRGKRHEVQACPACPGLLILLWQPGTYAQRPIGAGLPAAVHAQQPT